MSSSFSKRVPRSARVSGDGSGGGLRVAASPFAAHLSGGFRHLLERIVRAPPLAVIVGVTAVALLARAPLLWAPAHQVPDSGIYLGLAELLLHGHHYPGALSLNTIRTPGYPLLVAPLNYAPGSWEQAIVVFQHLTGVGAAAAVAGLSIRWFGRATAILAGLTVALSPLESSVERYITPDLALAAVLLIGVVLLVEGVRRAPGGIWWLTAAGVVFGAAAYVKPVAQTLCFAGIVPLALATRSWRATLRGSVALALPVLLFVGAWIIRNDELYHRATMSGIGDTTLFVRAFDEQRLNIPRDTADGRLAAAARQAALRRDPTLTTTEYPVLDRLEARGMSYEQASALMGRTARRAFVRAPSAFLRGAFTNLRGMFDITATAFPYPSAERELSQSSVKPLRPVTRRLWKLGRLLAELLRILSAHGLLIPVLLFVGDPRSRLVVACLGSVWLIVAFTTAAVQLPTDPRYSLSLAPLLWILEAATVTFLVRTVYRRVLESPAPPVRTPTRQRALQLLSGSAERGSVTARVALARLLRWRRGALLTLAAIVAAAAAVRIAFLFAPMRYDEAYTFLEYASHPWRHLVSDYSAPNNQLLHSLAVHASWRLFGDDEWALRLPALIAGIAIVPAAFLAGLELYGSTAGLWGAALVAGSSVLIQYSVNARGYTLGILFTTLALACGSWAERTRRPLAWAVFGGSAVLAVYALPTMAGGIAVAAAWVALNTWLRGPQTARWLVLRDLAVTLVLAGLLSLALYTPTLGDYGWSYVAEAVNAAQKWDLAVAIWHQWNDGLPWPVGAIVLVGFACGIVLHRRLARHALPIAPLAAVGTFVVAARYNVPGYPRTYLFLLPLYLLTAGAGLAYLGGRMAKWLRLPPAAPALSAAAVATVLGIGFAARGNDALTIDPPTSAPGLQDFARAHLAGRPLLTPGWDGEPISFYYLRAHSSPPEGELTGSNRSAGRVVLAEPRYGEHQSLAELMTIAHVRAAPGHAPGLIKRFRWLDLYEIRLRR